MWERERETVSERVSGRETYERERETSERERQMRA